MPWMIVHDKENSSWCVHKENADGTAGETVKCHPSEEKARQHMKALYANAGDMEAQPSSFMDKIHKLLQFIGVSLEGESLDEKMRVISDSFYKAFERSSEPVSLPYIEKYYDTYVICREGEKLYRVDFSMDSDGNITFQPRAQWKAVKHTESYVEMRQDFSFTELSDSAKAIDGLAANEDTPYISMAGQEVYIKSDELAAYIENTQAIIDSTKTESGEIVGLPIDMEGHNHKGGAGWIVGLELDSARKVIRFLVNWTEKGIELIKGNLSRFFSPSVDTENKIILGGSLTNWPASRNAKGQILLRPVELSQSIKEIDMEKTLIEMLAELPGKVAEAVRGGKQQESPPATPPATELETEISPQLKELLRTPEGIEELGKKAQELARDAIHLEKRKMHTVRFASKLAGGTSEHPVGLKVRPNEVVALLLSLPEPQAQAVEKILASALDGAVNFSMRGLDGNGFIQKPELPKEVKGYLRTWVDAGKTVGEFFKINLELGNPEDYNLSEFAKKEA